MSGYSFVIPVLEEEQEVQKCLRYLRSHYPDAELVVVDGGSTDQTVPRALPLCDQLLEGPPGRALQMNLGGRAAGGDYVFFLHVDTRPTIQAASLESLLRECPEWGFFRVRLNGGRSLYRLIEAAMNLRSRLTRVATGDQVLFMQRELFSRTGGFARIPLMEDVEMCKRLRALATPQRVRAPVITSIRRWEQHGALRTVMQMWILRFAYFIGVSPVRLASHYKSGGQA